MPTYRTICMFLALTLTSPVSSRLCANLATSEPNAQTALQTYNCTSLLADLDALHFRDEATTCPVGLTGAQCRDSCPPPFDAVVNADDARRCGCFASGGCAVTLRPLAALLRSETPGVVLIPDRVTHNARLVVCREGNCRPDPRHKTDPVPIEDTALCFAHGLGFERCPRCPAACANADTQCFIDAEQRKCDFVCKAHVEFSTPESGCVKCKTCPVSSKRVRQCTANRDTECKECAENFNQSRTDPAVCVPCAAGLQRRIGEADCRTPPDLQQSLECTACDNGEVRNRDGDCEPCPTGMRRGDDGTTCEWHTQCQPGEISVSPHSSLCAMCERTHHPNPEQTACIACPPGTLMPATGGVKCEACPLGFYLPSGAKACIPCELGRGVTCPPRQFLDRCTRRLENGEPCACACRFCPLSNDDIRENEQIFSGDGDCRVGCSKGYRRVGKECISDKHLLPQGLRGLYFLQEFNTSDPQVYRCSDVLAQHIRGGEDFGLRAVSEGVGSRKTMRETELVLHILPAWEFETALDRCFFACVEGLRFVLDAKRAIFACV